jgi:phosphotransferase system  glucose/maltose/N-acetylglucosamine-specific IIC component
LLFGFLLLAGFAFLVGRFLALVTTAPDHVLGSACGRTHGGSCSGAFGSRPQDRLAITAALILLAFVLLAFVLLALVLCFFGHRDPLLS